MMRRFGVVVKLRRGLKCGYLAQRVNFSRSYGTGGVGEEGEMMEEYWKRDYHVFDMNEENPFKNQHVLSAKQFTPESIQYIFRISNTILSEMASPSDRTLEVCRGKLLGNIFLQNSTLTSSSFYSGMVRLGGSVRPFNSLSFTDLKSDSIHDPVSMIQNYSDLVALRHPKTGAAVQAASKSKIPIINAGDGQGEHPTQALLDLYTVYCERQQSWSNIQGLTWTLVGHFQGSRAIHSLARVLSMIPGSRVNLISPEWSKMPREIVKEMRDKGLEVKESEGGLEEVVAETDVIYQARVKEERKDGEGEGEKEEREKYMVDVKVMERGKKRNDVDASVTGR
eukprot:TRINITY_DN22866_c0_g1_i1.p1 TRINITY_DN22866_c0_g1~~TRINITY_DN22866_c0_g1_i1.p1  ORF type:complete len:338 (-),score=82.00 TRINITY_DN22866_c0_g1_i1:132-1145(-)